ncbi:hypothetical protein EJD96_00215 (plasmid) [Herbaspirillum seropedicae]|uniref:hypothetical protein n=1 Tax=Herbaspirillum seropedicae TaxID=964 RepID=UPI00112341E7|nr:hypothetical protein [Herbaspirillum seropedicae]QDD62674.1 hypothetical protein EJD96_00215 [Herbaspirillum seropedicae]
MRTIIIELDGPQGAFNVREGDKHTLGVTWDEMLGMVAAMTVPQRVVGSGPYALRTDAEWEEWRQAIKSRAEDDDFREVR